MNIFITPKISLDKNKSLIFSLENNWFKFARKIKINLILASEPSNLTKNFSIYKPKGLIVTGGGEIYKKEKKHYNYIRDKNENKIISFFIKKKLPVLAVCRGFQLICSLHKIKLYKVNNHVRKNHNIYKCSKDKILNFKKINTNSFHNYGVRRLNKKIKKLAVHDDGTIEIAKIKKTKVYLTMFHPERKNKDQKKIDKFVKKIFKTK